MFGGSKDAYPRTLEQRFPHVIDRLISLWGTDEAQALLDSLTQDDGIPRRGFPPEVGAEVSRLVCAYRTKYPDCRPPPSSDRVPVDDLPQSAARPPEPSPVEPDVDIWKGERFRRF